MATAEQKRDSYERYIANLKQNITKTEFFDALGDAALFEFITLINAGDATALLFDYRIKATGTIDLNHEKTKAGLQWIQDNFESVPPGLLSDLGWL